MSEPNLALVVPDWPAPSAVRAFGTTRLGGVSAAPYASLNLAHHVGDAPADVSVNRSRLARALRLPAEPVWLDQEHGIRVVDADAGPYPRADGSFTSRPGTVCAVLTADCLPVLLCDRQGHRVAALHGGWRGLLAGVLEAGVQALTRDGDPLMAWLGPAIGPDAFEVGPEVCTAFLDRDPGCADAFRPSREDRWRADIYALARRRLKAAGVSSIHGGDYCTYTEGSRFYSYRRDGATGRMASLIWIAPASAAEAGPG